MKKIIINLFIAVVFMAACNKEEEQESYIGSYQGKIFHYCDGNEIDATQYGHTLTITESSWIEDGISHSYSVNGNTFTVDFGIYGIKVLKMYESNNQYWFIEDDYCNVITNYYLKYTK